MKGKKRGFTLIELVVTVAIVGVLATFIYSKISKSIAKGKDAAALSSVDALRKASLLYFNEQEKSFAWESEEGEIKKSDLENLVSAGYIEPRALKIFIKSDANLASVEVGSMGTEENCGILSTKGYIPLNLESDGVGIVFNTESYDSNCKEWKSK